MRRKLAMFAVVFLLVHIASAVLIQTVFTHKASAAAGTSFEFVDRSLIVGKDGTGAIVARYYDNNVDGDNTYKFKDENGCVLAITNEGGGDPWNSGSTNYLWLNPYNAHEGGCMFDFKMDMTMDEVYSIVCARLGTTGTSGTCTQSQARDLAAAKNAERKISVANRQNAHINYYLIDDTYIYRSDSAETYKRDGTTSKFYRTNDPDSCDDVITINADHSPSASSPGGSLQRMEEQGNGSCAKKGDPEDVYFGDVTNRKSDGPDGIPQTKADAKSAGAAGGGAQADHSCEAQGGVLAWIMCPVVKMIDGALDWVDTQIQALLEVDKSAYSDPGLHNAWAQVRNIAYIILIPIMLVMVISTALGYGFVDAYTVKRAMPKVIIAILFITLSWVVTTFLIQISNVIGGGVLGILTSPFTASSKVGPLDTLTLSKLFEPLLGGAPGILLGIAQGAAFTIGVLVMVWMFGGTLLIFAAVAFFVLLMRQLLVIALMLIAPLAILAWIFPGTDRWWKQWSNMFIKLLIMFPMIMGLIALGRIFAYLISIGGIGDSGIHSIISQVAILIVWVLPYAFIPFTFRFAGGIFATLSGGIQNLAKPLQEAQKQSRKGKVERAGQGNIFKTAPTTGLRAGINRMGSNAVNFRKAGLRPTQWSNNLATARGAMTNQEIAKNLQENPDYATWKGDDNLNRAAAASRNANELRHSLEATNYANGDPEAISQAVSRVERVRKQMSATAFRQMTTGQAIAGGTAYATAGDAWAAVAAAGENDEAATAAMVNKGRSDAMSAGRVDMGGASFGDTLGTVRSMQQELRQTGKISVSSKKIANQHIHEGVLKSQAPGTIGHSSMKNSAIKELLPDIQHNLQAAYASGDADTVSRQLAFTASLHDTLSASSPQNAAVLGDEVLLKDLGGGVTVGEDIENQRKANNMVFRSTRREYDTGGMAGAAAAGAGAAAAGAPGAGAAPPPAPPPGGAPSDIRLK